MGKHNRPIVTDIYYQETPIRKPLVIFCHGYKGFKDWGAWDLVAKKIAKAGNFFIKFNFSHNGGTLEQPIDFPDVEAFGENNYTKELDDLQAIIDWASSEKFDYRSHCDPSNIILIGHSRGAGIVTIKASEAPRVQKIISWAGVSDYAMRFPKGAALQQWQTTGVTYVMNGRTGQHMPHYYQFYTDFLAHQERLTISRAARMLTIPYLLIHGTKDEAVPIAESEYLHTCNPNSILWRIPDANHVFAAKHPWNAAQLPEALDTVVIQSIAFIK